MIWDKNVHGWVYIDKDFPNIKYFPMAGYYRIKDLSIGIVGGAYSVDKYFRLSQGWNWFEDEQIPQEELDDIIADMKERHLDIILTHTCPYSWMPRDLFLPQVDQNRVDNTTEWALENLMQEKNWGFWLYGHYHDDRISPDGRQYMLMNEFVDLKDIIKIKKDTTE